MMLLYPTKIISLLLTLISFASIAEALSTSSPSPPPAAASNARRSFLFVQPFVAACTAVATSIPVGLSANAAVGNTVLDGMSAFAAGDVERSISIYDAILAADPRRKPYLWQRGLALYYAERFKDGAEQFASDVAVNPNDTEEQIWHLLCLSRLKEVGSLEAARSMKLTVGKDRRPVMRAVQSLFLSGDEKDEQRLIKLAKSGDSSSSRFYASLYLSLYYESMGNADQAKKWMVEAVGSDYAQGSGQKDPMAELSKVAIRRRGWLSSV